ncbi:MAG: response regulator [Nitrospira sp.]|nr:response regulator [Nitrospira sp.]
MNVLLVEDNRTARLSLASLLKARGHPMSLHADAESALEACRQGVPLRVQLDWMLPGVGGLERCRRRGASWGRDVAQRARRSQGCVGCGSLRLCDQACAVDGLGDRHGGRTWAEGAEGQGAAIDLSLPRSGVQQ